LALSILIFSFFARAGFGRLMQIAQAIFSSRIVQSYLGEGYQAMMFSEQPSSIGTIDLITLPMT